MVELDRERSKGLLLWWVDAAQVGELLGLCGVRVDAGGVLRGEQLGERGVRRDPRDPYVEFAAGVLAVEYEHVADRDVRQPGCARTRTSMVLRPDSTWA